jgi:hypothetical protein
MGEGEHAQSGFGHLVLRRQQAGAGGRIERNARPASNWMKRQPASTVSSAPLQ